MRALWVVAVNSRGSVAVCAWVWWRRASWHLTGLLADDAGASAPVPGRLRGGAGGGCQQFRPAVGDLCFARDRVGARDEPLRSGVVPGPSGDHRRWEVPGS